MERSKKLNAALGVLEFKLNKQFSALVELMQFKIENDKKLQSLIHYQDSYASTNKNRKNQNVANVQLHHKLMGKLEEAIDSQQHVVKDLEYKVNQRIIALQKDRAKNSALGILVKRYHKQELEIAEDIEQKELDNLVLTMFPNDTRT
ncbi:MAG: flagellar export protein FliJ [Gammaproteobacteria bacterium]